MAPGSSLPPSWQAAVASGRVARLGAVLVLALAAGLLFPRLGERMLWGDEAETAVLALAVLEHGVPRVDVEGNRIVLYGDADADERGLWVWSPWLDEYVVAASLGALGRTAFAARLPMAIAGCLALALTMRVARRAFGRADVALAAGALLAVSVPFLLHCRQSRYYALLMLGQALQLHGFDRAAVGPGRRAGVAAMAAGLAVQGHSNYVVLPGAALALLAASAIERRRAPGLLRACGVAVAIGLAATAPWVLWAGAGRQAGSLALSEAPAGLVWYLRELDRFVLPLVLLALPLLGLVAGRRRSSESGFPRAPLESLLWAAAPAQLLVLSLSPQRYLRYLVPLFPVLAVLAAVLVVRHVRRPVARVALLAIAGLTNLLSLPGGAVARPSVPLWRYVSSLAAPYDDRTAAVVRRLAAGGAAGETVYVRDPEFPLIFHARVRVVDARLVREPAEPPRWILPRSASGIGEAELPIAPSIADSYERIEIQVPASRRGGGRPDPLWYEWRTARKREPFVLYRRRDGA